jgi:membrane-bound lytic murein transglycosylase D
LIRAKKYEPTIRQILRKKHLPEDLVYVAMIESGFNMKACSRANAMGPWQFMDETGRQYGLRVDYWMDERYNLEKATVAAARYLKKLFDQFGCWYLATAGYNAGENRVRRAVEDGRTKDFWELREQNALPKETQEYVPQLIAATVIAKDPERYGFTGTGVAPFRPAKLSVPGGVPLREIAKTVSVELADLRVLNPELLQGIIPPDVKRYRISLPEARKASLSTPKMKNGLRWRKRVVNVLQHRVKAKDTVKLIERRYRVTQDDLLLVNAGGLDTQQGQIIYIPRFAGGNKAIRSSKAARARLVHARTAPTGKKSSLSPPSKGKASRAVRTVKK